MYNAKDIAGTAAIDTEGQRISASEAGKDRSIWYNVPHEGWCQSDPSRLAEFRAIMELKTNAGTVQ